MCRKNVLTIVAVAILALAIGQVQAVTVTVPNSGFELIYKPGQTTITGEIPGWTMGVGPDCPIDNGTYNFSDGTSGDVADIPGWLGYDRQGWIDLGGTYDRDETTGHLQGSITGQGEPQHGGVLCFNANGGGYGNRSGGLIVSDASLGNVKAAIYTLSMYVKNGQGSAAVPRVLDLLADGVVITPTSSVDPTPPEGGGGDWLEYTRTYDLAAISSYVGQAITIVLGVGRPLPDGSTGNQSHFDDVSLSYEVLLQASNPSPADEATDVCRNVVLSWTPGIYADKHDVYFGADFDDVNDANNLDPMGPDKVYRAQQDADADSYAIPETLDYGRTYYWRIDEVNAPPDPTIFKGDVWQFTIESVAYPIENVTATASSEYDPTRGAENTVNGSGLVNDLHSNVMADMWLSDSEPAGAWIEYAFDRLYKLHEMWVWNFNGEFINAYGLKGVTIEYSADGDDWTELAGVPEFAQAEGSPDYAHVTTVDFSGVTARYVKITANTNWGLPDRYGLSEVRFFYVPVRARKPDPENEATGVPIDAVLTWRAGRVAARHDLYLGTDMQAVAEGAVDPCSIAAEGACRSTYDPLLELGRTYYWKVNEVNMVEEPNTWEGDIWSFSTPAYSVVDDMESYNTDPDPLAAAGANWIFYVWVDGLGDYECFGVGGNGTGANLYAQDVIFSGGSQAMQFDYDNDGMVTNPCTGGEAARTHLYSMVKAQVANLPSGIGSDWTVAGVKALVLQFYGDPNNDANDTERMWVELTDTTDGAKRVIYGTYADEDFNDVQELWWHEWNIDLQDFADGGVDLTNVTSIAIGFGNPDATSPGGSGLVYFDDIRLYPSGCVLSKRSADFALVDYAPEGDPGGDCVVNYKELDVMTRDWLLGDASVEPVEPNAEGLMVRYEFENNANDSSGKGNHGTESGYPVYTAGHDGSALQFDGTDDYVNINDYKGILGSEPFSVTAWINTTAADDRTIASWGTSTNRERVDFRLYQGRLRIEHGSGNLQGDTNLDDGEWHHVAVTVVENGSLRVPNTIFYLDGQQDATRGGSDNTFTLVARDDVSIGRRAHNNSRFFEGLIDDVRIYDYALSQGEIVGAAGEGTLYIPLLSPANIYDSEPVNQKKVNFKDYALLTDNWLDEQLWP